MCCGKKKFNAGTVLKGFGYLASGRNGELSAERMKICNTCDQLRNGLSCNICGCFVDAKTRVPEESCPLNKWSATKPI